MKNKISYKDIKKFLKKILKILRKHEKKMKKIPTRVDKLIKEEKVLLAIAKRIYRKFVKQNKC